MLSQLSCKSININDFLQKIFLKSYFCILIADSNYYTSAMKKSFLPYVLAATALLFSTIRTQAQVQLSPVLSDLNLEARVDFDYHNYNGSQNTEDNTYGFGGRYFNIRLGGNLSEHFSYYLRQRIIATPGSSTLFDKPLVNSTPRGSFEYAWTETDFLTVSMGEITTRASLP